MAEHLSNLTWSGILTICGQDDGEYREQVCYGAMFDYAYTMAMQRGRTAPSDLPEDDEWDDVGDGFYEPGWFKLGAKLPITSYVNRHNRTVSKELGEWWVDEVMANFLPYEFLRSGLVKVTPITYRDWPCIPNRWRLSSSDIDWDSENDGRGDIDEQLTPVLRLDVSQRLCGRLQLAIGALFRYMTECGGNIHAYKALRDHTKLSPSQAFAVAGLLCPTDGHGIGSFKTIGGGTALQEFLNFDLPAKFLHMQDVDKPFYQTGCKQGMIDSVVTLQSNMSADSWFLSHGGYYTYENGKKKDVPHVEEVKIGPVAYRTHHNGSMQFVLDNLAKEGVL